MALQGSGDTNQCWAVVKGTANAAGTLSIAFPGSRDSLSIITATLTATKASPFSAAVLDIDRRSPPVQSNSLTCPTGGIIVGLGFADPSITGPVAGATRDNPGSGLFANYRKTTGTVGVDYAGGGYSALNTLVFEKSV